MSKLHRSLSDFFFSNAFVPGNNRKVAWLTHISLWPLLRFAADTKVSV
jgi:hypothetical protein